MRTCRTCSVEKPLDAFYVDCRGWRNTQCKACVVARTVAHRRENPTRSWNEDPAKREARLARARESRKRNGFGAEGNRRWRRAHPEEARLIDRTAAQLRRTPGLRESILARDGCCLRCGALGGLVIDHILPVLQGGTNDPDNLQTLCRRCNSLKRGAVDWRRKAI